MRLLVVALAACGGSQAGEPARGVAVEVEIASITLDDCGGNESVACPRGEDCSTGCDGAHLQLSLRSADGHPTPLAVQRVELLDAAGTTLALLPATQPMRWDTQGHFAPWNQLVGAGEVLAATYTLGKATWSKPDGHYDRSMTYRVRVTVQVGNATRAVEKSATVMPQPMVDT